MKSFNDDVQNQLNMCKVARKWYMKFNTQMINEYVMIEFTKEITKYDIDLEKVVSLMKDYYINHLEAIIEVLKEENKEEK